MRALQGMPVPRKRSFWMARAASTRFLTDADEIVHGLRLIVDHYGYTGYPLERCSGIEHLLIGRILLDEITGKHNLPGTGTPVAAAAQKK